ncbi:MAG: YraN family protein [Eubacterium sp.]|nr:YraN family protein [Eubacterium sp.]
MAENKRTLGGEKEHMAGAFLEKKGHRILEYNFRTRMAEADLVTMDGDTLVFVEVKYRRDLSEGHPLEAVHAAKQRRVRLAALYYLEDHNLSPDTTAVRFDVIGILGDEITHVENAF